MSQQQITIEKMSKAELMDFVKNIDPIKYHKMNWFKGATTKGLRVQVRTWYNREHKNKNN